MFFGDSLFANLFIPFLVGFLVSYFLPGLFSLVLDVLGIGFLAYITITENWEGMAGLVLVYFFMLFIAFVVGQGLGFFFRNFKVQLRSKKPKKP